MDTADRTIPDPRVARRHCYRCRVVEHAGNGVGNFTFHLLGNGRSDVDALGVPLAMISAALVVAVHIGIRRAVGQSGGGVVDSVRVRSGPLVPCCGLRSAGCRRTFHLHLRSGIPWHCLSLVSAGLLALLAFAAVSDVPSQGTFTGGTPRT